MLEIERISRAAGGAIILGSAPRCPEIKVHFDWPDAVVEVSPDGADVIAVMDELDNDPQRASGECVEPMPAET